MKRYTRTELYKTKEEQLEAVKEDGHNIQYMHNPDKEVQLEAVKQDGWSIRYIHNPDKELQLEAVKQNGNSIQSIHNPDKEVVQYLYREKRSIFDEYFSLVEDNPKNYELEA